MKINRSEVVLGLGCSLFASSAAPVIQAQDKISKPGVYSGYSSRLYTERERSSVYITTRDGTRLAADIFRPAKDGKAIDQPYPVIWEGTTVRGKVGPDGKVIDYFQLFSGRAGTALSYRNLTDYGYVLVLVERRGLGASFGHVRGYEDWTEIQDAYDVTEWLAKQPWSDGNVGVQGCSNTGEAAMHTIIGMPPHLKGVFAGCWNWDKYDGFLRGGILANWGSGPQLNPLAADAQSIPVDEDIDKHLLHAAIQEHLANTNFHEMWTSTPYRDSWYQPISSRFWLEGSTATYQSFIERTNLPIYMFGGWKDDFRLQMFEARESLHNPTKILIGPWGHCQGEGFDFTTERLRYFDAVLKGVKNHIFEEPPIYYYTANAEGGSTWRSAKTWPLPAAKLEKLSLTRLARNLTTAPGFLSPTTAKLPSKDTFAIDYTAKCPAGYNPFAGSCLMDGQGSVYKTVALATDLEVAGTPTIRLTISADADDANVFAYLEDVSPDGSAVVVTDARLRASLRKPGTPPYRNFDLPWHRNYAEDREPLVAGDPVVVETIFLPCSYVFKAGHTLRVRITGYDPRVSGPKAPAAHLTIYSGPKNSSEISLPVIAGGH